MDTSFLSLHLVGIRFFHTSKGAYRMEKSYPHKMLLNMTFAYNSILCYLGWAVDIRFYFLPFKSNS
jgi:hypothetical protein